MKNIKSLSLFALLAIGALFLTNCGDGTGDPAPVPLLNFIADSTYISSDVTLSAETDFTIAVTASHSEKFASLTVTKAVDGGAGILEVDSSMSDKSIPLFEYSGTTGSAAGSEVYTFTVTDKDGISTSKSITITNLGNSGLALIRFEEDNDGNPFKVWNFTGPKAGAYGITIGDNLLSGDNDSDKDIQDGTLSGETFGAKWTSRNGTTFKKVSGGDWNTIENDATIEAAWAAGGTAQTDIAVVEGDTYLLNLAGSDKYAIVLITAIDVTEVKNEFVQFVYKKQQ